MLMKKSLFFALLLSGASFGQTQTIDFEELSLPVGQDYWNGSDLSGGFTLGTATFSNLYNSTYSSWSGFVYSAVTDNTTAGYGNQYSAFPGTGASGSAQYGIWYLDGTITFTNSKIVDSIKVSNDTYTAISMRDGDPYAKQFGSIYAADGTTVDGTNGEDWFKLTITGWNENGDSISSVDFYLADYRFSDNSMDYIVDSWKNIDLSAFGWVKKLTFSMSSSDIGMFGMNTPGYFVVDNIVVSQASLGFTENTGVQASIYPNPTSDVLNVSFNEVQTRTITILSTTGKTVKTIHSSEQQVPIPVQELEKGVYFAQIQDNNSSQSIRFLVK
jgi:hypothetical protein